MLLSLREGEGVPFVRGMMHSLKYDIAGGMRFAAEALGILPEDVFLLNENGETDLSRIISELGITEE